MLKISASINSDELSILKVKYSENYAAKLSEVELLKQTKAILFRIHTITGWKIPDDQFYLNTIVSELSLYLKEINDLTIDEVLFAIRNYGLEVEDWGKSINLSLIHKPIQTYRSKRAELSELERRLSESKEAPQISNNNNIPVDWSDTWQDLKEKAKNKQLEGSFCFIPAYLFEWIITQKKAEFTAEDKWQATEQARQQWLSELKLKASAQPLPKEERTLIQQLNDKDWKKNTRLITSLTSRAQVILIKEVLYSEIMESE